MRKILGGIAALLAVGAISSCTRSEGTVVARVGKETLTREQLLAMVPPELSGHAGRDVYLDMARRWIRNRLLAREALRLGLDDNLEVRRQIHERTEDILSQALVDRILDTVPEMPEAALRKYYDDNQQEFLRQEPEVAFRRLRLPDQATAAAMRQALTPVGFASEVQRLNPDPSSALEAQRFWRRSELPPNVAEVLFDLQEGMISPPVQVADGWALFLVVSRVQAGTVRPFSDVVDLIRLRLTEFERKRRLDEVVAQLARQSGTEIVSKALPGSDSAAPKK
ncbi:MAG TPA: peptidyl-prolyl cis-trans isomerase [Fibrobacteria bacterium]|nr:peptidyl-prolyl cis-trans isomerase [Fibrobacteria bacterium]